MSIVKESRRKFSHKTICCLQTMLLHPSPRHALGVSHNHLQNQKFPPTCHCFISVEDLKIV